jgi:membrane AbrB-like protein
MRSIGRGRRGASQWAGLALLSAGVAFGLDFVRLPAAFLIGPLVAAIAVRLAGAEITVARPAIFASQAVVGAMIGAVLTPAIVATVVADWPVIVAVVTATVVFALAAGWMLSRFGVVPGTTGVWGSSPGAATAMVILAETNGGDVRLVAFMQYLRVLFVASAASIGARLWLGVDGPQAAHVFFPAMEIGAFALTLGLIAVAGIAGHAARLPSGAMIGPLFAVAILQGAGLATVVLPPWLLIAAYTGLGWNIGLRFTRASIAHAARALPWIVLSILVLMGFSAGLASVLVVEVGVDPLTAFLATSPGGLDTIAIIAASTPVDVSFVLALQAVRFFGLVLVGPTLSRAVAALLPKR